MALPSLTLRLVKGSPLTLSEMDTNLTNLQQATIAISTGSDAAALNLNDTLTFAAGSGMGISIDTSTKTVTFTSEGSALNTATDTTLGGVKIGSGISITDDGTISATTYTLTTATTSTLGGVKIGSGISITSDGTISAAGGGSGISTGKAIAMAMIFGG